MGAWYPRGVSGRRICLAAALTCGLLGASCGGAKGGGDGGAGLSGGASSGGLLLGASSTGSSLHSGASSRGSSSRARSGGSGGASSSSGGTASSGPAACGTLTVSCGAYLCPPGSVCGAGSTCSCPDDTLAVDCDGGACGASCVAPNWWCAPLAPGGCGALNFDVNCTGDAGVYQCPSNGSCAAGDTCSCKPGYAAQTCKGAPCGSCVYPNWWCAPADAG